MRTFSFKEITKKFSRTPKQTTLYVEAVAKLIISSEVNKKVNETTEMVLPECVTVMDDKELMQSGGSPTTEERVALYSYLGASVGLVGVSQTLGAIAANTSRQSVREALGNVSLATGLLGSFMTVQAVITTIAVETKAD